MNEEIYNKLEKISDLKERTILKNIIKDVFSEVCNHSDTMYHILEQRVFEEVEYEQDKYNIYTGIVAQEQFDPIHDFLFPMCEEDLNKSEYDLEAILEALIENKRIYIFKVFLKCDYLVFKEILKKNCRFKGSIRTNKKSYVAYFEIEKDETYNKKIEELYSIFVHNQIPWHTINAPYINKIINVYLVGVDGELSNKEEIEEIVVDFGEYSSYVYYDMVPLWNIKHLVTMGTGFAMPCENKLFYEHKISLRELGEEHGYLVESQEIESVRHTREYLYITVQEEDSVEWNICQIVAPKKKQLQGQAYEVMSNAKRNNFMEKMVQKVEYPIKTKAEILRLLNVLEAAAHIELATIKIISVDKQLKSETYELNEFIIDEIRDGSANKVLLLSFYEKGQSSYLTRDILSFIVAEIQRYYPEYRCEGQLL